MADLFISHIIMPIGRIACAPFLFFFTYLAVEGTATFLDDNCLFSVEMLSSSYFLIGSQYVYQFALGESF